jgi:hypothetical protein
MPSPRSGLLKCLKGGSLVTALQKEQIRPTEAQVFFDADRPTDAAMRGKASRPRQA